MRHISIALLAAIMLAAATSCGKSGGTATTGGTEAPITQAQDSDAQAISMITDFYTNTVLNVMADAKPAIEQQCTERMKRKLSAAYDSEYADGGGYAVWELRSGVQDGDGDSRLQGVTPQGDGWYLVSFTDMGTPGTKRLKVVRQGARLLLDDYQ